MVDVGEESRWVCLMLYSSTLPPTHHSEDSMTQMHSLSHDAPVWLGFTCTVIVLSKASATVTWLENRHSHYYTQFTITWQTSPAYATSASTNKT